MTHLLRHRSSSNGNLAAAAHAYLLLEPAGAGSGFEGARAYSEAALLGLLGRPAPGDGAAERLRDGLTYAHTS